MEAGGLLSALVLFFAGWFFVKYVLLGLIAGFIAEKISGADHTVWQNIGLGVLGSLAGGFLASLLHVNIGGIIGRLVIATIGALALLYGYRAFKTRDGEAS